MDSFLDFFLIYEKFFSFNLHVVACNSFQFSCKKNKKKTKSKQTNKKKTLHLLSIYYLPSPALGPRETEKQCTKVDMKK